MPEIRRRPAAFLAEILGRSAPVRFGPFFGRIRARELPFWADPEHQQQGQINHGDGGRGVYWNDPDGHYLEIITRPYARSWRCLTPVKLPLMPVM